MERIEEAAQAFGSGLNCSQAVLGAFCEGYGMDRITAQKIACGLGSGCRSAEVCGAVSGGILVVGLKYGADTAECNTHTEGFIRRFKEENGSIICREILECDITTPQGKENALQKGLFTTTCLDMVKSAVRLLCEAGY